MIRHFTSTGVVVANGASLVHWHKKVQAWLAPGGHVEPNEDPVQAVLREVEEETGLKVRIMPTSGVINVSNLEQVTPPFTVMVEDVFDQQHGAHQHIDFIYFTTPFSTVADGYPAVPDGWQWVKRQQLADAAPLESPHGEMVPPPDDVLKLSIAGLDLLETGRIP